MLQLNKTMSKRVSRVGAGSGKKESVVGCLVRGDSVTCQQPAGFSSFCTLCEWRNVPPENHREEEGTDSKQ